MVWYTDCVNLHKALLNGRNKYNYTPYIYQETFEKTSNIDDNELIRLYTDKSSNFNILKEGEPRILYA